MKQRGGFVRELRLRREKIPDANRYPFTIPAIAALDTLPLSPQVTFLVGENGSGKSTLIEAMAVAAGFNPEGGTRHLKFTTRPTESDLHTCLALVRGGRRERSGFFLRAESLYNAATAAIEQDIGWEDLHARSHGEAFLWLLENRFGREGLFILDEPEAALSPQRQLSALQIMHTLVADGGQFVIATHSPILMAYPGATIYTLSAGGIQRTRYEDTEHYQITRSFLASPERYFKHLFGG